MAVYLKTFAGFASKSEINGVDGESELLEKVCHAAIALYVDNNSHSQSNDQSCSVVSHEINLFEEEALDFIGVHFGRN